MGFSAPALLELLSRKCHAGFGTLGPKVKLMISTDPMIRPDRSIAMEGLQVHAYPKGSLTSSFGICILHSLNQPKNKDVRCVKH